ncbi:thiol reductant ABC exporter subunit CydC [Isoptericola sp. b490]|uniref:thiol reductant ABC exporter subunit CydC n=1 Tax=Actinotalea lenta TaxID=3064654 RepID=UPI0027134D2B|nr:thiol reductant ABC exporter subunit CydC [Isoptericola sp. b490]MDO8120173.1 thiol reductant ABC exporter subunit CydC [Isoptericola sp. b490]
MRRDPLWRAVRLLEVDLRRVGAAVAAGVGGLGSAIALAAVSAWLIARAAQMPPVSVLSVAAVSVRLFGISRGVLRYVERLASHDVALRGMATLRVRLYERLATTSPAGLVGLRRGDLLARVGADVDAVGDVVVRGLLPMAVAGVLGVASAVAMGIFLPAAGLTLAGCLLLAGVVAPWIARRGVRAVERDAAAARADLAAVGQSLLDGAAELTVTGRVEPILAELRAADSRLARATDRGAVPAALAAALGPAATGLAVLAALAVGIPATTSGGLHPVELAVVVLTPLAVFESTAVLPGAAVALLRSREAARRIVELLDTAPGASQQPAAVARPRTPDTAPCRSGAALEAHGLVVGWPDGPALVHDLDLTLEPGRSVAVVGPSGLGKTTLLLTLAGLLPAKAGTVLAGGAPVDGRATAAARVALTAEDSHVFDTSVLENLRVARGDVSPDEATRMCSAVGLDRWLEALPHGLETRLGSDAARISGGERRRLLVARALLAPAPVLLLDEPTEHLDTSGRTLLAGLLDGSLAHGRAVLVVTHRLAGLERAGEVILLDATGTVRARGTHTELLTGPRAAPAYRAAWQAEQQEIA